jgi:8-oxo-dGTP diphosphatase
MIEENHVIIAAGILRQEDKILLVEQQGKNDPISSWALSGGVVEKGELITEALVREVKEETGFDVIEFGELAYFMQVDNQKDNYQTLVFVFEIPKFDGTLSINDPDDIVLNATFLRLEESIQKLELLPWRSMKEPLVEYLKNSSKAANFWQYRKIKNRELIRK